MPPPNEPIDSHDHQGQPPDRPASKIASYIIDKSVLEQADGTEYTVRHSSSEHATQSASEVPPQLPESLTFQLLAAAAPLAGGSAAAAWDSQGLNRLMCCHPGAQSDQTSPRGQEASRKQAAAVGQSRSRAKSLSIEAPPLKLQRTEASSPEQRAPEPTSSFTEVTVTFDEKMVWVQDSLPTLVIHVEHPRWCVALAELRSIQTLSLSSFSPASLSPEALGRSLLRMRALRTLKLTCSERAFDNHRGKRMHADRAAVEAADQLMHAACALTQISALELHCCFVIGEVRIDGTEERTSISGVSRLSCLTQLTSLAITAGGVENTRRGKPALVRAVAGVLTARVTGYAKVLNISRADDPNSMPENDKLRAELVNLLTAYVAVVYIQHHLPNFVH